MSFDSFQTSGNSPGRARRIALPGFGSVGAPVSRRLIYRTQIPGLELAAILEDQSQLQPETIRGVRLQSDQVRPTPGATGHVEAV